MKKFLFILFISINLFSQNIYYVSKTQGSDNNSGLSKNKPWKSISKVNTIKFNQGDKILFKCNEKWIGEQLNIKYSGTKNNPILVSSYGTGNKPILTLKTNLPNIWKDRTKWSKTNHNNVWKIQLWKNVNLSAVPRRLWLDNIEYLTTKSLTFDNYDGTYGINETHRFMFKKNGLLYLWAPTNPAEYYDELEYSGIIANQRILKFTLLVKNVSNIIIDNLDLRGGLHCAIRVINSNNITLTNCNIGLFSQAYGMHVDGGSNIGEIYNCSFDSAFRLQNPLDSKTIGQIASIGLGLNNGCSNYKIFKNKFVDWTWGIQSYAFTNYSNKHHIFANEFTAPSMSYAKAIEVGGNAPYNIVDVHIYNNYMHDFRTFALQICASNIYAHHNIIKNITKSSNMHNNFSNGGGIFVLKGIINVAPKNNFFFNNTIVNCNAEGFRIFSPKNYIFNNFLINCATASKSYPYLAITNTKHQNVENNFCIGSNLNSNKKRFKLGTNFLDISNFNKPDNNTSSNIKSNIVLEKNILDIIDTVLFTLPSNSPAINAGVDISKLVPKDFRDRNGVLVNRKNPNIGALGSGKIQKKNNQINELKLYLEAPYASGRMNTNLLHFLPTNQPYNISPWKFSKNTSVSKIKDNYIDWLLIELRNNLTNTKYKKVAILTNSGKIINPADGKNFYFSNIRNGNYYIVINHRNHLSVMSSKPVSIKNNVAIDYNFTDSQTKAYGNNPMTKLDDGKFAMPAGDIDANGKINDDDYKLVADHIPGKGYDLSDTDFNVVTNVLDFKFINKNRNRKTQVPK